MKITKLLQPSSIVAGMKARTKSEAIVELLDVLIEQGLIADPEQVRKDLFAREKKMSTGMEQGLAIPHAKSAGVEGMRVALGTKPEGIEFESLDGEPARVIFLVLSPKGVTGPHIQCLAEIALLYARENVRTALLEARSAWDVLRALEGVKVRI